MVKKILADAPIDPNLSRYCKEGGIDAMADASTWPDDIRSQRPETSPWHYIDIPLGTAFDEARHNLEKFCPKEGCVISAIRENLKTLRSPGADARKKADALRFLIHFVGDLHQPLHAVSNNDLGGNCVPVAFFDQTPKLSNPQLEIYSPNLHGVWDTNILEKDTVGKTVDQLASELNESLRTKIARWEKAPPDIDAWAWESYLLGVKSGYGELPVRITAESPQPVVSCVDDNHVSARMLKLGEHLSGPYQTKAAPIVGVRLAQAGARLGALLNRLWQ
jgi:nuclease S1